MAGLFDEFDDATPLRHSYCGRISKEDYERQAEENTESAIEQLLEYLEKNPEAYTDVVKKRRKEEAESAGYFAYLKAQIFSLWSGNSSSLSQPTEQECKAQLSKTKEDMIKVFEFSQECRGTSVTPSGQRFSQRLRAKRLQHSSAPPPVPAAPPPPPLPPVCVKREDTCGPNVPLKRRPLEEVNCEIQPPKRRSEDEDPKRVVIQELQGSGGRKRLRRTSVSKSPGGTPSTGWHGGRRKGHCEPGLAPLFNHFLLQKFANARTPSPHGSRMASPGSFESPCGAANENCNP